MLVAQDLAIRGADDISINKPIALQHFANTLDRLTPRIFSEHRDLLLLLFKNNKDAFLVLEHDANQIVFLVQRIAGIEICDIEQRRSLVVPTSTAGLKITIAI